MNAFDFKLPDMSCGHCVTTITETLNALDPQVRLSFKRDTRELQVQTALPREPLVAALTEAGYPPA
ncbi:heavy-metal-associated domain-containing protein [Roseateles koreensis]|uniref:Heavy-metal-associated domain-containing protein n=1 Tax=Roseateles koreensis TaxID=2987526 RepID=A0ABT5KR24_9BURK|nr:heavy-metal-associated domain-containing protein [Roseateles koreensis]MDC8785344.1 heavy-metal-associated domain-containing protein [Roseateles koreensis]